MRYFGAGRWLAWAAAVAGFGLLALAPAVAGTITWNLNSVSFTDGGVVTSGQFTFDTVTSAISRVKIVLDAGSTDQNLSDTFVAGSMTSATTAEFTDSSLGYKMFFVDASLETALASPGTIGPTSLLNGLTWAAAGTAPNFSGLADGFLQSAASTTPEPATWALLGTGALMLLGLGYARRRGAAHTRP